MSVLGSVVSSVFKILAIPGESRAYLVAHGCCLTIYKCRPELQQLLLTMQADESVDLAYGRLQEIERFIINNRGGGFCDVSATPCRSIKEIESAMHESINAIEEGLSDAEKTIVQLRQGYDRLNKRMDEMARELDRMIKGGRPVADAPLPKVVADAIDRLRAASARQCWPGTKCAPGVKQCNGEPPMKYWHVRGKQQRGVCGVIEAGSFEEAVVECKRIFDVSGDFVLREISKTQFEAYEEKLEALLV